MRIQWVPPFCEVLTGWPRQELVAISPIGELDMATADDLDDALTVAMECGPAVLLVDLEGLTFMDSTGVRVLFEAWERAQTCSTRAWRWSTASLIS